MKRYIKTSTEEKVLTQYERIELFGKYPQGEVVIPEGYTEIGMEAFENCDSLTRITIPESVTSIDLGAFSGCVRMSSITMPESFERIGNYAFCDCTGLTSISIPASVKYIGFGAFLRCKNLESVNFEGDIDSIIFRNHAFGDTPIAEEMSHYYHIDNYAESHSFIELPKNIATIIESTMPSDDGIDYSYDIYEDEIDLYANASDDFDYEADYEGESLDFYAIERIGDWARAIAKRVDDEELKKCILRNSDTDWYSGMTFYGGGDRPFTYDGFSYTISLEV